MNEAVTGSGLMRGRRGLIMGVANEGSIAWSIAAAIAIEAAWDGIHNKNPPRNGGGEDCAQPMLPTELDQILKVVFTKAPKMSSSPAVV